MALSQPSGAREADCSDSYGSESEDEDEEDSTSDDEAIHSREFEAICDFMGEQPGDLQFKKGQILTVITTREDGWWEAVDSNGVMGLVPSTFLESLPRRSSELAKQESGKSDESNTKQSRAGSMWKKLGKAIKKPSALDVLTALGALPAGCTESILSNLILKDPKYTTRCALIPKLSETALNFRDLFWDASSAQLRPRNARIQRVVTLVVCRNIFQLGTGLEVLSRHVRICLSDGTRLSDGTKFLSNVHTVQATWDSKTPKLWNFSTQAEPSSHNSDFFIRSFSPSSKLGIFFELCVIYRRTSSGESGELSCGWAHVPLLEENSQQVSNRTCKVDICLGTPFQKPSDLAPVSAALKGVHPLRAMIQRQQKPMLVVKLGTPSRNMKALLDWMPDPLVACTHWLPALNFYRQTLADVLLTYRTSSDSAASAGQSDIMDTLLAAWSEKLKQEKRINKRDPQSLRQHFEHLFVETAYVLCHMNDMPPLSLSDTPAFQRRKEIIDKFMHERSQKKTLAALLSSTSAFSPFDMRELALDLKNPLSISVPDEQ